MIRIWLTLSAAAIIVSACTRAPTDSNTAPDQNGEAAAAEGAQLFGQGTLGGQAGCSSCHSTSASPFGVGPSLAEIGRIAGERVTDLTAEEYLRQSIVDPNAYLVDDYTRGLMPRGYVDTLTTEEIDNLVQYLLSLQ
jgi:mono/diheme cytochrome c family protein